MRHWRKPNKTLLFLPVIYFVGVFESPRSANQSAIFGILRNSPRKSRICAGRELPDAHVIVWGKRLSCLRN
jgi:hypothetical protein